MKLLACLTLTLLASCVSNPTLDKGGPVTEVPVPVLTSCVEPADIAEVPPSATVAKGDVKQNAAGVIIDAKVYRDLAEHQRNLLLNCLKKAPDAKPKT